MAAARPLILTYWGRRGPIADWCVAFARGGASKPPAERPILCLSRNGEALPAAARAGGRILPVTTFDRAWEALVRWDRFAAARQTLLGAARQEGAAAVVTLMPHVWTPLVTPALRRAGIRTVSVVHDGVPHPGDPTARVTRWLLRDAHLADSVVTLSGHVTQQLERAGVPARRITTLFLPAMGMSAGTPAMPRDRLPGTPLRLLMLGRILPYKGLPLAVESLERLAGRGVPVRLTLAGEGDLGGLGPRLHALGADIRHRWLAQDEIDTLCASHDAMLLSYVSASQSGVAGLALAAGLPMVATPVGGLREQVDDGVTGLLSASADAASLARVIERLVAEPGLLARLRDGVGQARRRTSFDAFADRLDAVARG